MQASKRVVLAAAILGDMAIRWGMQLGSRWRLPPYPLQALIHHLLFVVLLMSLARGGRGKRLFVAVMLLGIQVLVGLFADSLISLVFLVGVYLANPDPGLVLGENLTWLMVCLRYAMVAAVILLLPRWRPGLFGSAGTKEGFRTEEPRARIKEPKARTEGIGFCVEPGIYKDRPEKWYVVLSIPLLGFIVLADVANWGASHGILVRSGGWLEIYYDQVFSYIGMCVLTVLSMLAAVFYLFGMEQMKLEQQKSRWYHARMEAYQMMEQQHRRTEGLRHDMKNHILALRGLAEGQEWGRLKEYLAQMADVSDLGTGRTATGNRVVDILLEQKEGQARELGISWDSQVQIPHGCSIREMDWCILLGNLLDNALKACGRMKEGAGQIYLRAGRIKGCFLLEVENSMDTGEAEGQGIGLGNIRDMVEQYDGTMEIKRESGCFRVTVLLPLGIEAPVQDMEKAV